MFIPNNRLQVTKIAQTGAPTGSQQRLMGLVGAPKTCTGRPKRNSIQGLNHNDIQTSIQAANQASSRS